MCGRTACTLDKNGIQRATCQYSKNNNTNLKWVEKYEWQNYQPSYNLPPSQISPVLVNEYAFDSERKSDIVITPMRWGLIPSWYKESLDSFSLKTNNCRFEGMLERPMYKRPAAAGQRCVILADGFYEWKVIDSKKKQPYFIYFPQENGPEVFTQDFTKGADVHIPRLLTMAGLFDVWKSSKNEVIYSYTVITLNSSKTVSFVHDRMPAILNGKDEVSMWLDVNRVPTKDALSIIKPIEDLHMHPVSTLVSYSKNNSVDCLKPFKESEKKSTPLKHTALTAWLKKGSSEESPAKRSKTEFSLKK